MTQVGLRPVYVRVCGLAAGLHVRAPIGDDRNVLLGGVCRASTAIPGGRVRFHRRMCRHARWRDLTRTPAGHRAGASVTAKL